MSQSARVNAFKQQIESRLTVEGCSGGPDYGMLPCGGCMISFPMCTRTQVYPDGYVICYEWI